jgi:hypothetical protein
MGRPVNEATLLCPAEFYPQSRHFNKNLLRALCGFDFPGNRRWR